MCVKPTSADSPWARYSPSDSVPWNLARVVHLYRRAAFGAPWRVLEQDLREGPVAAVDRMLASPLNRNQALIEFELMADSIGKAAAASNSAARLQAWWLYRMLFSPDPLSERLTLMWHNHFATSNRKVQDLVAMRGQNEVFRTQCRAPFGKLLAAVVKHPATLVWLDADSNRKGHPNENLARELMELFTLGIGNYTESDVQQAARALTGWTVTDNALSYAADRHDDRPLRVLGHEGPLNGDELLKLLVEHPSTARRLAWRLCHTFFGENVVDQTAIDNFAADLREHGLDIGWAVETILRSQLFFSAKNLRSRVLGPVDYVLGALRALELIQPPPSTLLLADWLARMGQELFYPPNVGGWAEGRAWLGSRAIVARANFASALAEGRLWNPPEACDVRELVHRHQSTSSVQESIEWLAQLLWGEPPLGIAEHALRAAERKGGKPPLSVALVALLAHPEAQLG